jgi:AcrR family transcriptional regulator
MPKTATQSLKARKEPVQERSGQTVEAIREAAIQVLLKEGNKRLTTTRVAERAGVSVGTLYQYYPNKQAILYALMEEHMELLAQTVQSACATMHGHSIDEMICSVIDAFVDAKMQRPDVTLALYEVSGELNGAAIFAKITKRIEAAAKDMLETVPGAQVEKIPFVLVMLLATISGSFKVVMERGAPPLMVRELKRSLKIMCVSYVEKELGVRPY